MSDDAAPFSGTRRRRKLVVAGPLGGSAGRFQTERRQTIALAPTPLRRGAWVVLVAGLVVLPRFLDVQDMRIAVAVAIAMLGAVGLNVLVGRAGQVSLAASGFLAVGAFSANIMTDRWSVPFVPTLLAAMGLGAILGAILALPALRLRGLYLILATLGFYWLVWYAISEYEASRGLFALTGLNLAPPELPGIRFDSPQRWYYFLLAVNVLVLLVLANLKRTKFDRAWVAIRDRDIMARAVGVNVAMYKVAAFAVSSAVLSLAGAIGAFTLGTVSASYFSLDLGIQYLAMIVIGGLGSVLGAYLGATFVVLMPYLITDVFNALDPSVQAQAQYLPPLQTGLFGLAMILFLIFEPQGLAGIWERIRSYFAIWPMRHTQRDSVH